MCPTMYMYIRLCLPILSIPRHCIHCIFLATMNSSTLALYGFMKGCLMRMKNLAYLAVFNVMPVFFKKPLTLWTTEVKSTIMLDNCFGIQVALDFPGQTNSSDSYKWIGRSIQYSLFRSCHYTSPVEQLVTSLAINSIDS